MTHRTPTDLDTAPPRSASSGRASRAALLPLVLGVAAGVATVSLLAPAGEGLAPTLPLPAATPVDLALRWSSRAVSPEASLAAARDGLVTTVASLGAAACLLALGAVATLLTAAGSTWRRELAVRGALGEGLGALAGRLLAREAPRLLGGLGTGLLLGAAGAATLHAAWPFPRSPERPFPWLPVSAAAGALVLACGAVCAFLVALPSRYGRGRLGASLAAGSRATADPREGGLRRVAAVFQVAGSLTLLSGALLLVRALPPLPPSDRTAGADDVTLLAAAVDPDSVAPAERSRRYAALLRRLRALPTIASESIASPGAWTGLATADFVLAHCGACRRGTMAVPFVGETVLHHAVSPGFFGDAGVRLVAGRDFRLDEAGPVAIVNAPFARKDFEDGDPLGRRIRIGAGWDDWYTVVGVVEEDPPSGLGRTDRLAPAVYLSALQHPPDRLEVAFLPTAEAAEAVPGVREAVREAGLIPRTDERTAGELHRRQARPLAWAAAAAGALGLTALLAALLGIHRVAAVEVGARRREIGVRLAVGASRARILRYVLARVARSTLLGAVLAVPLTVAVAARMREALGDVPVFDPVAFTLLGAALLSAAVLGALGPARWAARTPPGVVMTEE